MRIAPKRFTLASILVLASLAGHGCDQGLAPQIQTRQIPPYGISGTIYFKNWPPADSILDLRLAALQRYPVQDLFGEILQGRARYSPALAPYGVDSLNYTLILNPLPPGEFPLVGVAEQFGPNLRTDWRVVGIYYAMGDTTKPGTVTVPADSIVPGINVTVDFLHLPPFP